MLSYNHEKYLSESIESVLNQSFKDFELIIVDDFSRDNSRAIIDSYQRKDKRIKAYFNEKNLSMPSTSNVLLSKASGKYAAFIDSDDVWERVKLERQLAELEKNDSLVVWSEGEIIDENSVQTGKTFTEMHFASRKKKSGRIFEELMNGNFVFESSFIFKRDIAKGIHFDEKLSKLNDAKFMVDLAKKHQFFFIKEPLVKYRIHGKNIILSAALKEWNKDIVIINKYFLRIYGKEIPKSTTAILYFEIARNYYFLCEKRLAKFFFLKALKSNFIMYQLQSALTKTKKSVIIFRDFLNLLR